MSSRRPITYGVQRLIIANVIIFAITLVLNVPFGSSDFPLHPGYWLAFNPSYVVYGAVWQFLTYMFLHANLSHVFFNMLGLYFFGPDVERILSTRQFFKFYLLCGAGGALLELVTAILGFGATPVVGASGAVLGVLAAYAVAYPKRPIYLFPLPIPVYAWALAVFYFIASLTLDMNSPGTAWAAHAGGMATGFAYMKAVPGIRAWFEKRAQVRQERKDNDPVGEAVDNIFKFDDEKRRRK